MNYKIIATYCEEPKTTIGVAKTLEEAFEKAAAHFEKLVPFEDAMPTYYHAIEPDSGEEHGRVCPRFCEAMLKRLKAQEALRKLAEEEMS